MMPFKYIFSLLFGCVHANTTWPQTQPNGETHVACLECGREIPYNFEHLGGPAAATLPPLMTQQGAEVQF